MAWTREQVMTDLLRLFHQLADDWEYAGEITPNTLLFSEIGLQSLDIVVLAMSIQERYGQVLPFPELFADMGQQGIRDISVADWVAFVYGHLDQKVGADVFPRVDP